MASRKGFDKPIFLVVSIVLALLFVLAYWTSTSEFMQGAFDSAFSMATGFSGGGGTP